MLMHWVAPQRNGGAIIFLRAAWITGWCAITPQLCLGVAWLSRLPCQQHPHFPPVPMTTCAGLTTLISWMSSLTQTNGGLLLSVFAGTYAAFYARFASQWGYLADLYNQIKSKQIDIALQGDCNHLQALRDEVVYNPTREPETFFCNAAYLLAQWKVGFIEDAAALHLADKKLFSSVISNWKSDDVVKVALQHSLLRTAARAACCQSMPSPTDLGGYR
jgi:hypothetical protein